MSSFMRTVERQKVRTQMENNGEKKCGKKIGVWYKEFKKKKHEFLVAKKLKEQQNGGK